MYVHAHARVIFHYRSNFLGTSFTVYDSGVNPSRRHSRVSPSSIREEVALAHYVRTLHVHCIHVHVHVHVYNVHA